MYLYLRIATFTTKSAPPPEEENEDPIPSRTYTNLHEESTVELLKKDLNSLSGIYAFKYNNSSKIYVGSSINLSIRTVEHLKNRNSNIYLQNAFKKHGLKNFTLIILEILPVNISELPDSSQAEHYANLIELEQKYLDLYINKYNINPIAGKSRAGSKHTEAIKELMSKIRTENPYFLNKTHSPELIEKIRIRMTGSNNPMFGRVVTDENKILISELFSKTVYLYDAHTFKLISKFSRNGDLVKELNISSKTLIKYKDSGMVFRDKYLITSVEIVPNKKS
jgi:group I intron endonuclease